MGWIGSVIIVLVGGLLYLTNRFPNLRISHFSRKWDTKAPAMAMTETNPQSTRLQTQPTQPTRPIRIIVAMTGATGAILGIRLLERLREMNVETHLVISRWAVETIKYETKYTANDVRALATRCYPVNDAAAAISSGSFQADGMIIVPCSMRTLSAVRTGFADDLICRAADVTLKERRKLVLVVRETPLSGIHLENMLDLTRYGAVIFPPMPAFYTMPESVDDIVTQSVGRMLDMFGLDAGNFERWDGF
ncbi:flavo protein [Aspergillus pseudocaelatus]|uniref:Flavin prenyltransferase PAD1, mitochondrial n=1 Tax=Aspergillus pseudocaelatus TaxID=1825620 RepID=A0ABQ6WKL6_9EURO|nr:flavo protein [Aspergillus pseudocaelatus]